MDGLSLLRTTSWTLTQVEVSKACSLLQPPARDYQKYRFQKRDWGQIYSSHLVRGHSSHQGTSIRLSAGTTRTHGLRLMIKEEALPLRDQPNFPALTELAKRGLLSAETWHCNRLRVSLKTSIDVPMLGTVIEQNGDGLLEESHMPVGWPLHIDGAVRQRCIHRDTTLQEQMICLANMT